MIGKKVYPKMIVDGVKFDTSAHLPDSAEEPEIISEIKQHMFDYGQEGLDEVVEVLIRSAWQDQGFCKVLASSQTQVVSSDSAYEHVVVTIHVDPGQQYRLGGVRFRSSDHDDHETLAFPREELRKLLPLREGDIFNVAKNQREPRCDEEVIRLPRIPQFCGDTRHRGRRRCSAHLAGDGT